MAGTRKKRGAVQAKPRAGKRRASSEGADAAPGPAPAPKPPPAPPKPVLEQVLDLLQELVPPRKWIEVRGSEEDKNIVFLRLERICYVTSRADTGREGDTMFVVSDTEKYYNAMSLKEIEKQLGKDGGDRFFRSAHSYIINMRMIRAYKVADARTLWFEGVKDPVENAVTGGRKLEEYLARGGV